jgi:hypothetical protein
MSSGSAVTAVEMIEFEKKKATGKVTPSGLINMVRLGLGPSIVEEV